MRSRIDIKVRLAAHILAVVIAIFIWSSVVPRQTFDSSRFADGGTTQISLDGPGAEKQEWTQPAPVVDALPAEQTPPEQITEPVVDVVEPPADIQTETPTEDMPVETPEDAPVQVESDPEPVVAPAEEPAVEEPVVPETLESPSDELVVPPAEPQEFFVPEPVGDQIAYIQVDPAEAIPVPEVEPVQEEVQAEPTIEPDPAGPQPDETGALAVADPQLPEAASLPLPEIDGLEFYRDGLYWLVAADAEDERLGLLPNGTPLLYLYGSKQSLPNAALLNSQLFLANEETLTDDSAEQFLRVVDNLRLRPAGLAAAVVLSDTNASAFYKGVYLLVVQGLEFDAALAAIEPELRLSGDLRDEIIHRLRRLDLTPLKRIAQ
jgi:hypothetical protein